MTEQQWLTFRDSPELMLYRLPGRTILTNRKRLLFHCACFHRVLNLFPEDAIIKVVDWVAAVADKPVEEFPDDLENGLHNIQVSQFRDPNSPETTLIHAARVFLNLPWFGKLYDLNESINRSLVRAVWLARYGKQSRYDHEFQDLPPLVQAEQIAQCEIYRDIFGNPFRPVTFEPNWRTATVNELASGMYQSKDFEGLPILADALEEAGCNNEEILRHCRESKTHVRGCWVIDHILDKK